MTQLTLYNTRTRSLQPLTPYDPTNVRVYSCGPTVYDYVHIGNLSAFIAADILRRVLSHSYPQVTHVMNFTDVDDKTIRRSRESYPDMAPRQALQTLTEEYSHKFLADMVAIGNDTAAIQFIKAADDTTIQGMRELITSLYQQGFAYTAADGVYFNIEAYRKSGKIYGQLVELTNTTTSAARIQNDEYDKDAAHDFALWKRQKPGEPAWDFHIDGHSMPGRPGWHIECSVMSRQGLGQPFDIHTGGIDLVFPHHENEIAQSTAGQADPVYAAVFMHNEHILVDGKKMSKSLGNFYTLHDLLAREVDPLAFRLLVLQSHYRKPTNFSFHDVQAAANRLRHWREVAALRHQIHHGLTTADDHIPSLAASQSLLRSLQNDIDTPAALRIIDETFDAIEHHKTTVNHSHFVSFLEAIDSLLGMQLLTTTPDISDDDKKLIVARSEARSRQDWQASDSLRDQLAGHGVGIRDSNTGPIWYYL